MTDVRVRKQSARSQPPPIVDDPVPARLSDERIRRLTPRELVRACRVGMVMTRRVTPGLLRKKGRTADALAPRLHKAVVDLGPPFVKLSQLVASSPGLFPGPISDELRVLLDSAPPDPWPKIRRVIEDSLGGPVEDFFAEIDPEPLAAASVAQVHAARLKDGSEVVVKVRRPGIERRFLSDLRLLRVIARSAARLSSYARVLNPVAIVDQTVATLREELDFRREAAAMERFAANLGRFGDNRHIRVPAVHRHLTTSAVLTMERVRGTKVDDLPGLVATGFDLLALLRAGVRAWIEAACEHGFFHGDVHAGNLLVDEEGHVVFLDFGIMGELDDETRKLVRRGVVALLHDKDFAEVTRCLVELGAQLGHRVKIDRAAEVLSELATPHLHKPISEINYQEILSAVVRRAAPHGVQLPRSLVLLAKQVMYFERYAKLVAPDYEILADTWLIEFMVDTPPSAAPDGDERRAR